MSNILIIKHGSLGDIAQIAGVLRDIKESNKNKKIFILTTSPYAELLSYCPYIDVTLIDQRLPRWNLYYLIKLRKMLNRYNFTTIYDLQNSSRTSFYRKFLLKKTNWYSAETTLDKNEKRKDFYNEPVLERFAIQLKKSDVNVQHTLSPDLKWAKVNVDKIINKYFAKKFILLFPFCSPQLSHKKWPYFNDLIKIIKSKYNNLEIAIAPGPLEIKEAENINAVLITNNKKTISIIELAGLIEKSSYVISNDTGPAHMTAHLGQKGVALFGHHTTPEKVSIETEKFKTIRVDDLKLLKAEDVFLKIKGNLDLIN
jgi:ADP-heptose:LPS heptosyltransferase